MRWDDLFADLEVDADGLLQRDRDAEIAERTRTELAGLALIDRLRGGVDDVVALQVTGVGRLEGRLRRVSPAWLLLDVDGRGGWAVALAALSGVEGLSPAAASGDQGGLVAARTTWASAFRVLSRDREVVVVRRLDGSSVRGVPARVGRDFVEMWLRDDETSPADKPRPGGSPTRLTVVPYAALAAVSLRLAAP
jgi:hypothetical protein